MAAILTAAEMRALEAAAIERGEVTGLELMERAGRGVVEAILAEWPGIEDGARRAVVLCGPGNNGGDGFVVARLLRERGWDVEVFLYGDAEKLPPDAKANYDRWSPLGGVRAMADLGDARLVHYEILVDAVIGIGLTRSFKEDALIYVWDLSDAIERDVFNFPVAEWDGSPAVVAIDVPSGLCADSGRLLDEKDDDVFWPPGPLAHLTVTFHTPKPGHYLADGPELCGKLRVVDIGLPVASHHDWRLLEASGAEWRFQTGIDFSLSKRTGHKYTHGHAVVLAGGCGKGGAARMAARGALRIGAGLVTVAVPPAALQENASRLDAVMLRSVRDAEALTGYLADERLNALCAGPGLGTGEREGALVGAVLAAGRPTVLDGDALTLIAHDDALRARLHAKVVLTPHEGEFKRLFPAIDERWRAPATAGPAFSKVDAAREAAKAAGCVVLLKGPDTVIADPAGRAAINAAAYERAAPWLATAGSGDVLAGFVTGLLARGFAPFDAACTGAWLHVECARSFGPGLVAEDLPEELPKVLRALLA